MARPPPGGKAAQASQALAGLAASGTRRPLPCSSAQSSGGLDDLPPVPTDRPGSPRRAGPRVPLALSPRPGVRGGPGES